ncbi:MAG: hypothetical protein II596_07175, partial [Thermoguttaceae bacterium]|nr:hypothetical protein [Thermoguttaceae bacterium]
MKQIKIWIIVAALFVFSGVAEASKVTIKSPQNNASAKKEPASKENGAEKSKPKASDDAIEMKSDVPVAKKGKTPDAAKEESEPVKKKPANASSKSADAVETLIQPPAVKLTPMTDAERDSKYPIVPDALAMTL